MLTWVWVSDDNSDDYLLNIQTGATIKITQVKGLWSICMGEHILERADNEDDVVIAMTKLGERLRAEYPSIVFG